MMNEIRYRRVISRAKFESKFDEQKMSTLFTKLIVSTLLKGLNCLESMKSGRVSD